MHAGRHLGPAPAVPDVADRIGRNLVLLGKLRRGAWMVRREDRRGFARSKDGNCKKQIYEGQERELRWMRDLKITCPASRRFETPLGLALGLWA